MIDITVVRRGTPGAYYIGRPSPLGNPFFMKDESMRDEVCDRYEEWFKAKIKNQDPKVMDLLRSLYRDGMRDGYISLACYCAPKRCHGDTIKRFLSSHLPKPD